MIPGVKLDLHRMEFEGASNDGLMQLRSLRMNTHGNHHHSLVETNCPESLATQCDQQYFLREQVLYLKKFIYGFIRGIKSVLGRVCGCVGKQAPHCEVVVTSSMCQPNYNYADSMFRLYSDPTHAFVVSGVLHSVQSQLPTKGIPTVFNLLL